MRADSQRRHKATIVSHCSNALYDRMTAPISSAAKHAPSAARNREPILRALAPHLPPSGLVLEIAAGSGEHAVFNAAALPHLEWLPTDADSDALASIDAWKESAKLPNLREPMRLDAAAPSAWPIDRADVMVSINMIHIAPWSATEGLMEGAARILMPGSMLFLYGPYFESDVPTAQSNLDFDESLRRRNPAWGIRNLDDVTALASGRNLKLAKRIAMPANNLSLVFRKL